jgi:hypothetical protein
LYDQRNFYHDDPNNYEFKNEEAKEKVNVSVVVPPTDFDFEFWLEAPFANKVTVAGEFNGWNKDVLHM